ncbi:MAG: ROK family protein [Chloroflexi bacterium OHK40]
MSGYAIGIDVGGTKLAGGVVELASGRLLARRVRPTQPERGGEAVLADALALAEELLQELEQWGATPDGLGVAVCELVAPDGSIGSGQAVAWQGLPVRERFAALGPAVVEADVRAHALAEARYGAGRPFSLLSFVGVGTGISACLVQDGRPFAGARGNALVLASGALRFPCPSCGASSPFVLEAYASGPALVARYHQRTGHRVRRAEELVTAADAGDEQAAEVLRSGGAALGAAVAWLVNVLDPEAVVLGGGLGAAPGLYWDELVSAARAQIWAAAGRNLPILRAQLGADAGVVGAALLGAGFGNRTEQTLTKQRS